MQQQEEKSKVTFLSKSKEGRASIDKEKLLVVMLRDFEKGIITRRDTQTLWVFNKDINRWYHFDELAFKKYILKYASNYGEESIAGKLTDKQLNDALRFIEASTYDQTGLEYGEEGIFQKAEHLYPHILPTLGMYVDLKEMKAIPSSPDYYKTRVIPIEINEEFFETRPECDQWKDALDRVYEGDPERIALIQEMFGYCLIESCYLNKLFCLTGQSGAGKSTILDTLRMMLNGTLTTNQNISSVPISSMHESFSLSSMMGRFANISDETPRDIKKSTQVLKSLSSGAASYINPKGSPAYSATIYAKLIFTSNETLLFEEANEAINDRLLLIPHFTKIRNTESDNKNFVREVLFPEIRGIFWWSVRGAQRLLEDSKFTPSKAVEKALNEMDLENSPIKQFIQDRVRPAEADHFETTDNIFKAWVEWAQQNESRFRPVKMGFMKQFIKYTKCGSPKSRRFGEVFHRVIYGAKILAKDSANPMFVAPSGSYPSNFEEEEGGILFD